MTTAYVETDVLVAVMDADLTGAENLLSGFLDHELTTFERQVTCLRDLVSRESRRRAYDRRELATRARAARTAR